MYLFATLCLVACFAIGLAARPRSRGGALLSAGVLTPFGGLGAVFVPAYWQPDHVVTFVRGVGPEDFLFCFGCGGLCWLTAGGRWAGRPAATRFTVRFLSWAALSLAGVAGACAAGCGILAAVIVGFTAGGGLALWQAPRVARLMLPGAVGFTLVYAGVSWLVLAVYPQSAGFWAGDAISGHRLFGLPVEELIWAATFGATWPVVLGYCLGERLTWRTDGRYGWGRERRISRLVSSVAGM